MSFYEAVTAPTGAVIHDHLDLLPLVLCHRLVRRDVAVAAVLIVTALTAHGHVVADELGTLFAREAVYDTRNLSHVFLSNYSKISVELSRISRTASYCAMR